MNPKQLYLYALSVASTVVRQVEPEKMEFPTPDTEWTVHDLLQHILYELAWTADIVQGKTIKEVGNKYAGDLFGKDPVEQWQHYEKTTRTAVESCNVDAAAHLSYTDKPVGEYLYEAGNDQLIHAWDLGESIGVKVQFDETAAKLLYEQALNRKEELLSSGLFAYPVDVPDTTDIQTKLLALLGRANTWESPG